MWLHSARETAGAGMIDAAADDDEDTDDEGPRGHSRKDGTAVREQSRADLRPGLRQRKPAPLRTTS